jgi:hypothetical protein
LFTFGTFGVPTVPATPRPDWSSSGTCSACHNCSGCRCRGGRRGAASVGGAWLNWGRTALAAPREFSIICRCALPPRNPRERALSAMRTSALTRRKRRNFLLPPV